MLAQLQTAPAGPAVAGRVSDQDVTLSIEWLSGASVRLKLSDLSRIVSHPHARSAAFVVALVQALIVTWGRVQGEPVIVATYVFCAGMTGIFLATRAMQLAAGFARAMGWRRLAASPVQGLCLTLATVTAALFGCWLTATPLATDQLVLLVIANLLFGEAAVSAFAILWVPALLRDAPAAAGEEAGIPAPDRIADRSDARFHDMPTVAIGDTLFDCRDLRMMAAENSYIAVTTQGQHKLLRARLSDAAQQVPATFGVLVHRSCWLAREMIERVERLENRQLVILTRSGQRIPVARARRQAVQDWLARVGIAVTSGAPVLS